MNGVDSKSFGLVIAYLLPGFVLLAGLGQVSDIAWNLLYGEAASQFLSVGGFLYSTVAALTLGLLASTVRWLLIDSLHHATGLRRPSWNFGRLEVSLGAYMTLVENHYRYYQFYANGAIAWLAGYCCWRWSVVERVPIGFDVAAICLTALLLAASRNTLRNFYERVNALLSSSSGIITSASVQGQPR